MILLSDNYANVSARAQFTMGHLIKKITPELTPEITPNYVN